MAFNFKNAFNKFADSNNKLNRTVNNLIGKEVFGEMKKIEDPETFPPYNTLPQYNIPEPKQWSSKQGNAKKFELGESIISVSPELDSCIQYKSEFKQAAEYYANRFKFKYNSNINSYDSLLYYFNDMYLEGLLPMLKRAYSLLLPFNVFNIDIETFTSNHIKNYQRAITSYETMFDIQETKNQNAKNIGDAVGNSVQMRGGGFGFKGAMKGFAQAEAFNLGMGLLGKFVENQQRMSFEEKANIYSQFNIDLFFDEVYSDYYNSFYTLIHTLSDQGIIADIKTKPDKEFETILINLQNPMFPQDKLTQTLAMLIQNYPFDSACYELAKEKLGYTKEVKDIIDYFIN